MPILWKKVERLCWFLVIHLPFAGALCNQLHYVFFFGYIIPLCVQSLLCGFPLNPGKCEESIWPLNLEKVIGTYYADVCELPYPWNDEWEGFTADWHCSLCGHWTWTAFISWKNHNEKSCNKWLGESGKAGRMLPVWTRRWARSTSRRNSARCWLLPKTAVKPQDGRYKEREGEKQWEF